MFALPIDPTPTLPPRLREATEQLKTLLPEHTHPSVLALIEAAYAEGRLSGAMAIEQTTREALAKLLAAATPDGLSIIDSTAPPAPRRRPAGGTEL